MYIKYTAINVNTSANIDTLATSYEYDETTSSIIIPDGYIYKLSYSSERMADTLNLSTGCEPTFVRLVNTVYTIDPVIVYLTAYINGVESTVSLLCSEGIVAGVRETLLQGLGIYNPSNIGAGNKTSVYIGQDDQGNDALWGFDTSGNYTSEGFTSTSTLDNSPVNIEFVSTPDLPIGSVDGLFLFFTGICSIHSCGTLTLGIQEV